jgi:hypothetical protein
MKFWILNLIPSMLASQTTSETGCMTIWVNLEGRGISGKQADKREETEIQRKDVVKWTTPF